MSEEDSEDSPLRPSVKRIKRVLLVESGTSSGSESDGSVIGLATRKKKLRVVSDEDGSESSSSSIVMGRRRRGALPKLRDSGAESDTSGWATDNSDAAKNTTAARAKPSGFSSDSSDGESKRCSICIERLREQTVGVPESCEHMFCLDCITEWSKNVNTCPVDRSTFNSITVRSCWNGRVLRTEPVKLVERRSSVDLLVVEDPTYCEICGSSDSEETLLLCDGCDQGFHMACLDPPLQQIPIDQWFCPECAVNVEGDFIYLSEVNDLLTDLGDLQRPLPPRRHPLREPQQTRRSNRNNNTDGPSTSTGRGRSNLNAPSSSRSASTRPRQRRRRRRRKQTRTVLVEYEINGDGKFPVRKTVKKKLRRKKKKRTAVSNARTAARRTLVRGRVRAQLQTLRAAGSHITNTKSTDDISTQRYRAGITSLSLFGSEFDLEYFSDEEGGGGGEVAPVSRYGGGVVSLRPAPHLVTAYRQTRRKMLRIPSPTPASSACDILSTILESQTRLHSKSIMSASVDRAASVRGGGAAGGGGGAAASGGGGTGGEGGGTAGGGAQYDPARPTGDTPDDSPDDRTQDNGDCPNFKVYSAASVHIAALPATPRPITIRLHTTQLPNSDHNGHKTDSKSDKSDKSDQEEHPETPDTDHKSPENEDKSPSSLKSLKSPQSLKSPKSAQSPKSPESPKSLKSPESPKSLKSPESPKSLKSPESPKSLMSPKSPSDAEAANSEKPDDAKITESISEAVSPCGAESRSYTPCLDENPPLDTELISEEEEFPTTPPRDPTPPRDTRAPVTFNKVSKRRSRKYRERDREESKREEEKQKRRERKKDLERYDVRNVVSDSRRRGKDVFGRDLSPHRSRSRSHSPRRRSPRSPSLRKRSISPKRRSPSPVMRRRSPSPKRRSPSLRRRSPSVRRSSPSIRRRSLSLRRMSPLVRKRSRSPSLRRGSPSIRRRSPSLRRRSPSARRMSPVLRKRSISPMRRSMSPPKKKRSVSRGRKSPSPRRRRRRSISPPLRARPAKKKKRSSVSPKKKIKNKKKEKSPKRKEKSKKRKKPPPSPSLSPMGASPRASPGRERRRRDVPHNKEVFTSGNNILVSVSFAEQQRRRRRRPAQGASSNAVVNNQTLPVAVIDLARSPVREVTSPRPVIVLSDTSPTPAPPTPRPDQYDPLSPTPVSPLPAPLTLSAPAAESVLSQRPLTPQEKVMALLASQAQPATPLLEPPAIDPPAVQAPKLFVAKPSPIKSTPIKPLQAATKISLLPLPAVKPLPEAESPYSPGSGDFGDLFSPPRSSPAPAPEKEHTRNSHNNKRGKVKHVGVKIDEDNLKILEELPSSAVEMQVKSKFLKKLNRQERVVEEVKLVLKPHYNKKHVTKDQYKDILRRAVPKICHNKSGEINPTKIQALVEAYVRKCRNKHKLSI